jgi:glutamate mutase epsilon subunit
MSIQEVANQTHSSVRVRKLFAAMLKALVKREFDYEMRDGEAIDLAQYGSLSAAIASIRKRREINQQFPDSSLRNTLSVQEAAILAGTTSGTADHARERILTARETAFGLLSTKNKTSIKQHEVRASLRARMTEIKSWGRDQSRFVSKMENLYKQRIFELELLSLPNDIMKEAVAELEKLFETALETRG